MDNGVSHKDYVDAQLRGLLQLGIVVIVAFGVIIYTLDVKNDKATKVAFDAANEKGIQHNGVLDMLQKWIRTTITWPMLLAGLTGAGVAIGIYSQVSGV